jgi:hypothetical protein
MHLNLSLPEAEHSEKDSFGELHDCGMMLVCESGYLWKLKKLMLLTMSISEDFIVLICTLCHLSSTIPCIEASSTSRRTYPSRIPDSLLICQQLLSLVAVRKSIHVSRLELLI